MHKFIESVTAIGVIREEGKVCKRLIFFSEKLLFAAQVNTSLCFQTI